MRISVVLGLMLMGFMVCPAAPSPAQDTVLAELYGSGVHSYFAGQYTEAHDLLTTAIGQGSLDPRAYFFRGLIYSKLGRPKEAEADFAKGAQLEVSGADRTYPVGSSLQRVQGTLRQEIEKARQQARLAARTRSSNVTRSGYQEANEQRVLRGVDRPPPAPSRQLVGEPPASDAADPFGPAATPAQPVPAPAPAAAVPSFTPAPAGTDLFGAPTAPLPEVTPAADPFGPGADPFGLPTTPPAAPADTTVDPFADDPSAPAAPPASPPTAPSDDPFN